MRRRGRDANGGVALWAGRRARGQRLAEAGRRGDPGKATAASVRRLTHTSGEYSPLPWHVQLYERSSRRAAHGKPTSVAFLR